MKLFFMLVVVTEIIISKVFLFAAVFSCSDRFFELYSAGFFQFIEDRKKFELKLSQKLCEYFS